MRKKVLMLASVASMIDQFNMPNIRILQDMGYEVHVACNFQEGNTCDAKRLKKLKTGLSAMHVVWHQWDCPRGVGSAAACIRAYRQLWVLTGRYPFAWIHCHSPAGGVLSRMVAHRRGIRVIYTAHGFHFYQGAPFGNWLLYYPPEKLLSRWTDVLVTINREDAQFAKQYLCAGTVVRIPGVGMEAGRFVAPALQQEKESFRRYYGMPEDAQILLSVGELSVRKNHRLVLSVLPGLAKRKVYYLICGQGPLRQALLQEAERLGIGAHVRLVGFQEDVTAFYQNADVFVLPSIQEGLPAALMEAMAAGLPCVVSDIRGNRELISREFRFRLTQPEQLAQRMAWMLTDSRLRKEQGRRNQRKAGAYSQAAVAQRMQEIYRNMEVEGSRECQRSLS